MELQKAMNIIRTCRPQSNPYEVSWQRARKMLLSERVEDLYLYANTDGGGCSKEEGLDRERYGQSGERNYSANVSEESGGG